MKGKKHKWYLLGKGYHGFDAQYHSVECEKLEDGKEYSLMELKEIGLNEEKLKNNLKDIQETYKASKYLS